MTDLLQLQKHFVLSHLREGDVCADFTMGNGHDTSFLSDVVGQSGKVYAFDIQKDAIENTKKQLENDGRYNNYILIHDSHSNLKNYIKEKIKVGMFNLGYLPGGDKTKTTKVETTIEAIKNALDILDSDAILIIAVYPGHEEGKKEGEAIDAFLRTINKKCISIGRYQIINSDLSPFFYTCETGKLSTQEYIEQNSTITN